jgi:hypothetical protein
MRLRFDTNTKINIIVGALVVAALMIYFLLIEPYSRRMSTPTPTLQNVR